MNLFINANPIFHNMQHIGPIRSKRYSTVVSNQIEKVKFSYRINNTQIRSYSVTSAYPRLKLNYEKSTYIKLHEGTSEEKIERVFLHTLENILKTFSLLKSDSVPIERNWGLLEGYLLKYHSYQLPSFKLLDPSANLQELLNLFHRPLIRGNISLDKPNLSDYIFNPTETFWAFAQTGVPFVNRGIKATTCLSEIQPILDQCQFAQALPETHKKLSEVDQKVQLYSLLSGEKDATAAILLAIPHLDETTLLYELGCWNGQNLLNLLFYADLKGIIPKGCVGTDINYRALTMAQSVSSLFSIEEPFAQFHLSNALYPLDPSYININFDKEVRLALRLIPVLDPSHARTFLSKMRASLKSKKDIFIVSYAVPNGRMYEENLTRIGDPKQSQFTKQEFDGGILFLQEFSPKEMLPPYLQESQNHRAILNVYYTREGFLNLVQDCGFVIQHTISVQDTDNERIVVALSPK